jgi:hypothetical protein
MAGCDGGVPRVGTDPESAPEDTMTEPWTAKHRDQLLTRVSRTTVLSGALALVATAGISYGLAGATTAATLAADPAATTAAAPAASTTSTGAATTASSTGTGTASTATTTSSAATGSTTVSASGSAPVAASGGS